MDFITHETAIILQNIISKLNCNLEIARTFLSMSENNIELQMYMITAEGKFLTFNPELVPGYNEGWCGFLSAYIHNIEQEISELQAEFEAL